MSRGLTPPSVFFRTFGAFPRTAIITNPERRDYKLFSRLENIFSGFGYIFSRLDYIFSRLENNFIGSIDEVYVVA